MAHVNGPIRRRIEREWGLVVDADRIIGTWDGERWEDVPRKARLYTSSSKLVRPRYDAGDLEAVRWRRSTNRGYLKGTITSYLYENPRTGDRHSIYNLNNSLGTEDPQVRFAALSEFLSFAVAAGANIASPSSTLRSLAAASARADYFFRDSDLPVNELIRGARIQKRSGVYGEIDECVLYDISGAYVSNLTKLQLPRAMTRRECGPQDTLPDVETGFAHAVVNIPPMEWGPVPVQAGLLRFPTDDAVSGYWSFSELRGAIAAGADVMLLEIWFDRTGYAASPWSGFADVLTDMWRTLSPPARKLVKAGAVAYVGKFAAHGRQLRSWMEADGTETVIEVGGIVKPSSLGIHAAVTGNVRAQVYTEGILPFSDRVVSVHTDGVTMVEDWATLPGTGMGIVPGDWALKHEMKQLYLANPQRYFWKDYDDAMHYCVAGYPEDKVERLADRFINGYPYREVARRAMTSGRTIYRRQEVT